MASGTGVALIVVGGVLAVLAYGAYVDPGIADILLALTTFFLLVVGIVLWWTGGSAIRRSVASARSTEPGQDGPPMGPST